MELAAAAGSAATVVQLVDFAARTIKSTTSFIADVVSASKELEIIHLRVQHLEQLFENTRALACSYQNTTLALEPQNQRTLELLGHALTKCSLDLRELNTVLQKPVAQTDWTLVRMKRRVKHVLDEPTLRRLSSRLQDNIASLNSLLSGISMHNDSVIHKSIQQVASFVQHLPQLSTQFSSLHQETAYPIVNRLDRIDKILEKLSLADIQSSNTTIPGDRVSQSNSRLLAMKPAKPSSNAISRFEFAGVPASEVFPALELFTPAFRAGMQFLYRNKELHMSNEALPWVLFAFHELLADAHGAAARSYSHILMDEGGLEGYFGEALVPRRFYHKVDVPRDQGTDTQLRHTSFPTAVLASAGYDCWNVLLLSSFYHAKELLLCGGTVTTTSGTLHASFECTHRSKQWPIGEEDAGFVNISFIPKPEFKLPGVGVALLKQPEDTYGPSHSFLTTFNVLSSDAPILQAIKEGDRGLSQVLKTLKSGQHWAGDRDEEGRSLLSHAVDSGSRDMCALLLRMGASPQDLRNFKQMRSSHLRNIMRC